MFSKKNRAAVGVETARGLIEDPEIRQAAAQAASSTGQLGLSITKRVARRRTRRRLKRYQNVAQAVGPVLATYGPQAAQQLGLADIVQQKPKQEKPKQRTKPALAAGVLLGASTVFFLEPGAGRNRRQQVMRLVGAGH